MTDQIQTAKDWLGDLSKIVSRQKTKEDYEYAKKRTEALGYLINRVEELENRNKELEYASKYNGELNEFLQKRKLPPSTLGRHVVDVVMEYVEELEKEIENLEMDFKHVSHFKNLYQNQRRIYKQALEELKGDIDVESKILNDGGEKARQGLKGESQ